MYLLLKKKQKQELIAVDVKMEDSCLKYITMVKPGFNNKEKWVLIMLILIEVILIILFFYEVHNYHEIS